MITSSVRAVLYCLRSGATRGTRKSAHCLCFVGHTPGTVQTWKDTELDVRCGTEEILGFCFKELPPLVAFWNFIFSNILIMKRIPFIVQCTRAKALFNLRASLRSRTFRRHSRVPQVRTLCWRMRGMKWQQSASSLHP